MYKKIWRLQTWFINMIKKKHHMFDFTPFFRIIVSKKKRYGKSNSTGISRHFYFNRRVR